MCLREWCCCSSSSPFWCKSNSHVKRWNNQIVQKGLFWKYSMCYCQWYLTSTGTCTYTTQLWFGGLLVFILTSSSCCFSYQYFARSLAIIHISSSADSETRIQRNSPKCGNHHLSLAWGIWLPCISRLVVSNLPPVHFPCQVVLDVNHRAICPKLAFQWREQPTEIFYSIRVNFSAGGQFNWTECFGARWKSLIWKISEREIENR